MRLALAQYALRPDQDDHSPGALRLVSDAASAGADLILFPELCLSPFFPQFERSDAGKYLIDIADDHLTGFQRASREHGIWSVPNLYFKAQAGKFDASFMIAPDGQIAGISKMVHIAQAPGFYEQDYYTPSDSGFHVYETPFGRVGIVICFDRHFPESIRTCVLKGAQLILIPTANTVTEPREMFEWELRVAARQNGVWIAMCNRVGTEGQTTFCGDSMVVSPEGDVVAKAGEGPELLIADMDLTIVDEAWQRDIYLKLLRPDCYGGGPEIVR